ncbi:MAG: Na(+)-translocating NADH-quinone reductase subunit A [Cytophagales bacterium]|nr:Na(+)-translocating NADH-quinone reductase subunit A [Cytophagales bacterium]
MDINFKRGFDIPLKGSAPCQLDGKIREGTCAVRAIDFRHITRPKLVVSVGDTVKAGSPLFFDRVFPKVQHTSPASGEVVEIRRGEKRKLLEVVILMDKETNFLSFPSFAAEKLSELDRDQVIDILCRSGLWPHLIQRPFGVMADPETNPDAIFVSAIDTSPLASDYTFLLDGEKDCFQAGLRILRRLTPGPVHLSISGIPEKQGFFPEVAKEEKVILHQVTGPHPAGNVGVHIHHIRPINKGDIVWTLDPCGLRQIGKLFLKGQYDATKRLSITGPSAAHPTYLETISGISIKKVVEQQQIDPEAVRVISGNVLTGSAVDAEKGYLGFHHHQITLLPEENRPEFLGWILPSFQKLSVHRGVGLFSFLNPNKLREIGTNMHGEARAFVQTGAWEKFLPMDILLLYLIKAILAEDYDEMEALGIYELIEEDIALCEFTDVSKQNLQMILREGIDLMRAD